MLDSSELKKGVRIIYRDQPYEITESSAMFKGRGSSVLQIKLRNMITGIIIPETFRGADTFEEADLSKMKAKFIYVNKDKYVFCEENNSSKRFELTEDQLGYIAKYLKTNQIVEGLIFDDQIINISMPVKISLRVDQAPPGIKGDRASSGTKTITLETGAEINVPLFIEQDDIIEINTEKDEYVRRIEKK